MPKQKTVSLVLSSGGARGMAHIGVIEELEARGYNIWAVAGSSSGAVVGGLYAAGKMKEYKDWMLTLGRRDVYSLFDISFSSQGFLKGERVFAEMEKLIGDRLIEELPIPFTAVATDLRAKKEVWFRKGSLFKAIRASVSVPTILTPVISKEHLLVDGGAINPLPIEAVKEYPAGIVVAVNTNANMPYIKLPLTHAQEAEKKRNENEYLKKLAGIKERWDSYFREEGTIAPPKPIEVKLENPSFVSLLAMTIDVMEDKLIELTLYKHQPDIVVNISRDVCTIFEFYKSREVIEVGRRACKEALDEYEGRKKTESRK